MASKRTTSVTDVISGAYLALRAGEPLLKVAKGEWNMDGALAELKYRFGFWGSNGFNPWGSLETYGPVVLMQIGKKVVRWAMGGKSIKIGPLRVP